MNLNGSSGERYSIDKKKRYTGSNYTDYQIVGSGGYVARIFSRGQRKPAIERELLDEADSGSYVAAGHNDQTVFTWAVQISALIIAAAIGIFAVYPMYLHNLDKNWSGLSSLVQTMAGWNKNGVPAVVVGIVFQIFAFLKLKDGVDSFLVLGGIGLAANIVGIVAFTVLFSLILYIVQGAIAFIMRYLVIILLIVVGFLWLKKKLFG